MGIAVTGVGEATVNPDLVQVDLGVSVLASTVREASSTATASAGAVITALLTEGVAEEDVLTVEYSIQPEYDYSDNRQRLVGYRVANTVRATIRDVTQVGPMLDSVGAAAGDHSRVNHLQFGLRDGTALATAAREEAWNDAVAKATQLARLSGQKLGKATSITETVGAPPVPVRMMAEMAKASSPIQPGTTSVTVILEVEFEFQG
jgi:uncharacterized protein YggE